MDTLPMLHLALSFRLNVGSSSGRQQSLTLPLTVDANETIRSGALVTQGTQKGSGNNHNQLWILNVHTDHAYIMPWDPRAADVVLAGQNNESSSGTLASVQTVDPTLVAQQWTTSFADSG